MDSSATYLYCIVSATASPRVARAPRGIPGASRPSIVSIGKPLWLVLAEVPLDQYGAGPLEAALSDIQWVGKVAVAHEAVVEFFARQADVTVIPLKLFTMFSTPERAIAEMRARRRDLGTVLKRIAGCEEWGVRLTSTRSGSPRDRAKSPVARASSGAAFLAAKKQVRDDTREAIRGVAAAADTVYAELARIARDARRRDGAPEGAVAPVLDAAFLVPAARRAKFRSAAKQLAAASAEAGASMTLTGPWPAYNFVQAESR